MKVKIIVILTATLCLAVLFTACAETAIPEPPITESVSPSPVVSTPFPSEAPVTYEPLDTPVRVGQLGTGSPYFEKFYYSIESAVVDSDLVVDVTVTGWLDEYTDVVKTIFEAEINDTFSGEEHDKIILLQDGNSELTWDGYPLFQKGDRLLLFLKKADKSYPYDNAYWIIGAYTTVLDIQELDDTLYVLDRFGSITSMYNGANTLRVDAQTASDVKAQMDEFDPVLAEVESLHKNIFFYDDLVCELLTGKELENHE